MDAEDFQNVYKLLRGSRSALVVLDARGLYTEHKMIEAHEKLVHARELFLESRMRLLKGDLRKLVDLKAKDVDKEVKKLERKRDKVQSIVDAIDELTAAAKMLAERERKQRERKDEAAARAAQAAARAAQAAARAAQAEADRTIARQDQISSEFRQAYMSADGEDRLNLIGDTFDFRPVRSEADIHSEALYLIHTREQTLLVRTPKMEESAATVPVVSAVDNRPIRPFSRSEFLQLGAGRKMVLLTRRQQDAGGGDELGSESDSESGSDREQKPAAGTDQNVLDMGAFSQLLSAAQRSGLLPGADQVAHVRDREFRRGEYDRAFQTIDALYSRFMSASSQRAQQLSREDGEIAAGRIKISPKDLLAKRARDRQQTQEIERANRRFQVVLEGLRVLASRD